MAKSLIALLYHVIGVGVGALLMVGLPHAILIAIVVGFAAGFLSPKLFD